MTPHIPAGIDRDRLARTFRQLVTHDSPSREEGAVARFVADVFQKEIGAEVREDGSREQTGSQSGNLVVTLDGDESLPPLFLNAHLDTVEPGRDVRVCFEDGIFRSDGTTVLGGDDKAAVAILIETARVIKASGLPHPPLEIVFTVCEEIGLLGAKAFDPELLRARSGYALDSTDPDALINQAPAAIRLKIRVMGKSAHAGLAPETGISAIQLAAKALARIPLGRIDEITTANIGTIRGGTATNIIPEDVEMEGEVRSHDPQRLRVIQDAILGAFQTEASAMRQAARKTPGQEDRPIVHTEVRDDYPAMNVAPDHPLIVAALAAGDKLGRSIALQKTGGGSDANVFNGKGLATVILGIGMRDVHTTKEWIALDDMVATTELVLGIIEAWGR